MGCDDLYTGVRMDSCGAYCACFDVQTKNKLLTQGQEGLRNIQYATQFL